jgi:hypothetical protein
MEHGFPSFPGLWTSRSFEHVTPPITILIVDDDSAGAEALSAALTIAGFRTEVAIGGYAALETAAGWTRHRHFWIWKCRFATALRSPKPCEDRVGSHAFQSSRTRYWKKRTLSSAA